MSAFPVTVAIVGDVHGLWDAVEDLAALRFLNVDCTLLVGDFGEEDTKLVGQVAQLPLPKAVILGNHDAWSWRDGRYSRTAVGDRNAVEDQVHALRECHVAFRTYQPNPCKPVTVIGSRPFSWGGQQFDFLIDLYSDLYGVRSLQQSAALIASQLKSAPKDHSLILIGHNGPTGLGSEVNDICGVDFRSKKGGDHGDPDLRSALDQGALEGAIPAMVTFGHMHDKLHSGRGTRKRIVVDEDRGTVFVNAAVVPRIKNMRRPAEGDGTTTPLFHPARHFCLATLQEWGLESVTDVWVQVEEGGTSCRIAAEQPLVATSSIEEGTVTRRVMDTSSEIKEWHTVTAPHVLPRAKQAAQSAEDVDGSG